MKINKISRIFCISLIFLFGIMDTQGQTIMDGKVKVSNLAVSRSEDKLFVSMEIDVSALEIKSNQEVILTPDLAGHYDSLRLPSVIVAGRNRYYYHLRNGLSPENTMLYRHSNIPVIRYHVVIPYEQWMGTAALYTVNEICGCCSTPLSAGKDQLVFPGLDPKTFTPFFLYIRPQAKPKINTVEGSAYIDFPVNRTEIYEHYRHNPTELQKIHSTIDAIKDDADTKIIVLKIKGYASPEGSYPNNTRLAKERTEMLKEYVRKQYHFPDSLLSTAYEPEDWEGLERFVKDSDLKNKTAILDLIHSEWAPDTKEQKLKSRYPEDYAFLLKNVYPALRHSDYTVIYEIRAYTDVEEIKHILKTQPQKLSLEEMYLAAQEMEPGSDEHAETFEIAVRMFPEDETANLNAANTAMNCGDLKNAKRYLTKAGNTAEAAYARGNYAALTGDYEMAEKFFTEAAQNGISKAKETLHQIEELKK